MRFVMFYHSLVSDWNHGNAHFLRGVARELLRRGATRCVVYEPADGWSRAEPGRPITASSRWPRSPGLSRARAADALRRARRSISTPRSTGPMWCIVHEWNDAGAGRRGSARTGRRRPLRAVLPRHAPPRGHARRRRWRAYDLAPLRRRARLRRACIRDLYCENGWAARAWTWHEAADTRLFAPLPGEARDGDLVWIGNWGDDERSAELRELLIEPVRAARPVARASRRALTRRRAARRWRAPGSDYARLAAELPRARGVRALRADGPRAAPAVRRGAAGDPDDPHVRGAGVRHPAGLARRGTTSRGCSRPARDYLVARDGGEMRRQLRALFTIAVLARGVAERTAAPRSSRGTPARTASTSCSGIASAASRLRGVRDEASPSSARAWCRPTGTAPPRTTAGSCARWPSAVTRITFYEPDAYERQAHRDIARPGLGRRSWSIPTEVETGPPRGSSARGARISSSRPAASACSTSCSSARCSSCGSPTTLVAFWDVDAPATLDRVERDPSDPFRRADPALRRRS